jgi:hypothetical protein
MERRAGSAIVRLNGIPLLIPLNHLRKHILFAFFAHMIFHASQEQLQEFFINPATSLEQHKIFLQLEVFAIPDILADEPGLVLELMDITDGQTPGKILCLGVKRFAKGHTVTVPSAQEFEDHRVTYLCRKIFGPHLTSIDCIQYGTGLRRINIFDGVTWSILLSWPRTDRFSYSIRFVKGKQSVTFRDQFEERSSVLIHSYTHAEEMDNATDKDDTMDWEDISNIPPDQSMGPIDWSDSDDDVSPPRPPQPPFVPPHDPPQSPPTTGPDGNTPQPPAPPLVPPPMPPTQTTLLPAPKANNSQLPPVSDTSMEQPDLSMEINDNIPPAPPAPPAPPGLGPVPLEPMGIPPAPMTVDQEAIIVPPAISQPALLPIEPEHRGWTRHRSRASNAITTGTQTQS